MKKIVSLVMMLLVGLSAVQATTVIVMDTTQALLPGAEVKAGRHVLRTSFDGKAEVTPEMLPWYKRVSVSCEGYKKQRVRIQGTEDVVIVRLTPKKRKADKDIRKGATGSRRVTLGLAGGRATDEMVLYKMADGLETEAVYLAGAPEMSMTERPHILPAVNDVRAGRLTAGEVNDFAKWYLWRGIVDGSHKPFAAEWNLILRHRYTVQVMTKEGYPVASRAVSLLDGEGNTLFQAVTDNTGKAELWALKGEGAGMQIRVDEQVTDAKEWSEGVNRVSLDEPCEADEGVDVVFVFDATGSMGDELRYLQAEMNDVISRAKEATGGLSIRTGAVVYRDHEDEYLTRLSRLTDEITTTQAFIDAQEANGGGDFPEAVPEALMAALNSADWNPSARARIAFLILDAPCHQDSVTLALLHEQIMNAAALGVRIVPVVCSGLDKSGEYLLRALALATNGTSFFLTDDSGIGGQHLQPTTDSLTVEHLNDMMVRTITEFSIMPPCERTDEWADEGTDGDFIPDPFEPEELAADPTIPHGEGVHYLVDVTGKLLGIYEGEVPTAGLPIGVYFVKTYVEGTWVTRKILVR